MSQIPLLLVLGKLHMHLKMGRFKHVLVLSPLETSDHKDKHPKGLTSARALPLSHVPLQLFPGVKGSG